MLSIFRLLRIHQWVKNLMLFFPPFLGGTFFSQCFVFEALLPIFSFCFASSATYVLNDLLDKETDCKHPEKRTREIASGRISTSLARIVITALVIFSIIIAINISTTFVAFVLAYYVVSVSYSVKLKHIALVDIFCISAGFLLRLQAGAVAYSISISEWLFLSVFLLSVFLSTGKRSAEKMYLGETAHHHRKALIGYPNGFLEGTMSLTGGAVLVTYTMYVISRHSSLLLYTVPLCCFGLLRYILRIQSGKGGDPTESLLRDVPLLIIGLMWTVLVGWGIYGKS
jgi:4-hydroxybenzoate polyprenyltransferase